MLSATKSHYYICHSIMFVRIEILIVIASVLFIIELTSNGNRRAPPNEQNHTVSATEWLTAVGCDILFSVAILIN